MTTHEDILFLNMPMCNAYTPTVQLHRVLTNEELRTINTPSVLSSGVWRQ